MRRPSGVWIASLALLVGCTSIDFSEGAGGAPAGGAPGQGGGASATGGQGGEGGAVPTSDICGNGIDDDQDLLVDCEDPDCTDICNALPPGWTGFVSVRTGGCGPDETLAQTAYQSASGSPACTCGCDAPTCGPVTGTAYGTTNCGGGVLSATLGSQCSSVGNSGAESVRVTATNSCGAATASLVDPSVDSSSVALCVDPEGACVFQAGADVTCPSDFPTSSQYHGAIDDTRSCGTSNCSCSAPVCGTAYLYETDNCGGQATPLTLGSCVAHLHAAGLTFVADPNPSCTADGISNSLGAVSLSAPITVCCK